MVEAFLETLKLWRATTPTAVLSYWHPIRNSKLSAKSLSVSWKCSHRCDLVFHFLLFFLLLCSVCHWRADIHLLQHSSCMNSLTIAQIVWTMLKISDCTWSYCPSCLFSKLYVFMYIWHEVAPLSPSLIIVEISLVPTTLYPLLSTTSLLYCGNNLSSPGWLGCWQSSQQLCVQSSKKKIGNIIVQNQKETLKVMDFSSVSAGYVLIYCNWGFGQQIFMLLKLYHKYMLSKSENSKSICIFGCKRYWKLL